MNAELMHSACNAPKVVVAQIGAREHYAIPRMCYASGALAALYTDVHNALPEKLSNRLRQVASARVIRGLGRIVPEIPPKLVHSHSAGGLYWYARLARASDDAARSDLYLRQGKWFASAVARRLEEHDCNALFAFSTAALEALSAAKDKGKLAVLDEIAPSHLEQDLIVQERKSFPGLEAQTRGSSAAFLERLDAEYAAADRIIVNSRWSRFALTKRGVDASKITVVPVAYDGLVLSKREQWEGSGPLRVLWLGTLCLRKGFPYAIEAARKLEREPVQFTFAGPSLLDLTKIHWPKNATYIGQVPRTDTSDVWRSHHVFLFPTLSDGFGITQLEAMANGLPVIATRCCGDVVENGLNGLIVEPRRADEIVDSIRSILDGRLRLGEASYAAIERAREFSFARVWPKLNAVLSSQLAQPQLLIGSRV